MREYLEKCLKKNVWDRYIELRGEDLSLKSTIFRDDDNYVEESKRKGVGIRAIDKKEIFLPSTLVDLEKKAKKAISLAQDGEEPLKIKEIHPVETREKSSLSFPPPEESQKMLADFYWDLRECQNGSVYMHYIEIEGKKYIKTSEGTDIEKDITFWNLSIEISSTKDKRTINVVEGLSSKVQRMELSGVKESILRRLHAQLEGSKSKTGTFPCVLGPIVAACVVHEAVGHNCEAEFADQGLYWMKEQKIAPEFVNITDDGRYPGGIGTETFDDEGVPTRKVGIIKRGILKGFLTDRIHARKMDLPLTGSLRGASFKVRPLIRMRNIILEEESATLNELMEDIKFGYFCQFPQYSRVENFRFQVGLEECYEITRGEVGNPVICQYLEGDTFSFLENIEAIGKDSDYANFVCEKGHKIDLTQMSPSVLMKKGGIHFH
jgi:TldD protein